MVVSLVMMDNSFAERVGQKFTEFPTMTAPFHLGVGRVGVCVAAGWMCGFFLLYLSVAKSDPVS